MKYKAQILVVEDEPLSQDMLVRRLSSRGLRVATVSDGPSCLEWLKSNVPDLVLLDVQMPRMSGLEVLCRIREHFTHDALPVILVTALGESDDIIRGLESGANDYVVKPINLPVLLARMQVCLRIKYDVALLMEAERQRVLIKALGESCHQLAQPMTAVTMTLESLIHQPPNDFNELRLQLSQVLKWTTEVAAVIHRMQRVGTLRPVPYTERIEMFAGAANTASPGETPDAANVDGSKPDRAKNDAKVVGSKVDGAKVDGDKVDGAKVDGSKPGGQKLGGDIAPGTQVDRPKSERTRSIPDRTERGGEGRTPSDAVKDRKRNDTHPPDRR